MAYPPSQIAREFIVKMDADGFDGKFSAEAKKLSSEELAIVARFLELRLTTGYLPNDS